MSKYRILKFDSDFYKVQRKRHMFWIFRWWVDEGEWITIDGHGDGMSGDMGFDVFQTHFFDSYDQADQYIKEKERAKFRKKWRICS